VLGGHTEDLAHGSHIYEAAPATLNRHHSAGRSPVRFRALGSARPTNQEHRATPLELFIDLAYAFAATQVTAYMTHEHSLPGVIPGLLLLALLWERWTATPDWPWPRS